MRTTLIGALLWVGAALAAPEESQPPPESPASKDASAAPCDLSAGSKLFDGIDNCPELEAAKLFCGRDCQSTNTYCFDIETGKLACGTALPQSLTGGATVVAKLVGREGWTEPYTFTVENVQSGDSLLNPSSVNKAAATGPILFKTYVASQRTVSTELSSKGVSIAIATKGVDTRYEIPLDHGLHFVELGVLFALVPQGSQTLLSTSVPGSGGDTQITSQSDWSIRPALAVTVFPFGRRNGVLSPFHRIQTARRVLADLLGIQVATDFDLTRPFTRTYLGVATEWVSGFELNAGVALVQGQFLPAGYREGTLVNGEVPTARTLFMGRFYFGVTLSTSLIDAVRAIK